MSPRGQRRALFFFNTVLLDLEQTWGHEFHEDPGSVPEEWHVEVAAQVGDLPQEGDVAQVQ